MLGNRFWSCTLFCSGTLLAADLHFDLNRFKVNELPPGFTNSVSGQGNPGNWKIVLDEVPSLLAPLTPEASGHYKKAVLAQLARDKTDEHFPLLIYEPMVFGDFTVSARFKLVDGEAEQMAGIAFRLQDEQNYYYIRASALGNSFYFFKIVNGVRSVPIGNKVAIPRGAWHQLTIECRGSRIRGLLNGEELIPPLNDSSFQRGKIAFWTKSDSVSFFTDVRVEYTPIVTLADKMTQETLQKFDRLLGLKIAAFKNGPWAETPVLIASDKPEEIGQAAWPEEGNVIRKGEIYHVKGKREITVSMPLRDRNGDPVAAVRLVMKSFPGQTEKNAVARGWIVVKSMETKFFSREDLLP